MGLVEQLDLQDLLLHGSPFTFFSYGMSGARSRLDCFLVSGAAGNWCHNVIQRANFKLVSDHIPIVLSTGQIASGLKPFKFFNTWCACSSLHNLVSSVWREAEPSTPSLWSKFSHLRAKVKGWQSDRFLDVVSRSKDCEIELAGILRQPLPHNDSEQDAFVVDKRKLEIELRHLRMIEDQCWQQKSRVRWLKDGDLNTSYFHKVASGRRRGNLITPAMLSLPNDTIGSTLRFAVTEKLKECFQPSLCPFLLEWSVCFPTLNTAQSLSRSGRSILRRGDYEVFKGC